MTTKQLLIALMGTGLPKGEIKQEAFAFYNSKVGTSKYFMKKENPNTGCGSCIQRVKTNIWKWYHFESDLNYKGFVFTGRFVAHNMPLYTYEDGNKK
jgi:hypothetical protein